MNPHQLVLDLEPPHVRRRQTFEAAGLAKGDRVSGAERLLRRLVVCGLSAEALTAGAALCVELERQAAESENWTVVE